MLSISVNAKTRVNAAPAPLDKHVQKNLVAAVRDMKRAGIKPKVTSTFRTSAEQSKLYKCGQSRGCRERRGVYGANKPGTSLHEAGFAVDIAGIASKQHGSRKVTPQGKRVIGIMNKHGFKWRYGLKDPAHFEADPRQHGYKSVTAAIKAHQPSGKQPQVARSRSTKRSTYVAVGASEQKRRPPRRRVVA
ncbi:MAG TPA: D-alanyl-D-alanine carboxypeptidase family protein [Blastocatellia bacterium]|nr:D-alanyl-D-alanine carboxypeptidase family protein [Blastocatellia bacterium]